MAAVRYASLGYEVYGFDISERNIESCHKLADLHKVADRTHFSIQKAEELAYEKDYFDIVVGLDILHHVDIPRSLDQVRRVLAPGGRAVFREWIEVPLFEAVRNSSLGQRLFPKEASFETHITEDERKLTAHDIEIIRASFADCLAQRFALSSRLRRILPDRHGTRSSRLEQFDYYLMRALPFMRNLGGECVLVLRAED